MKKHQEEMLFRTAANSYVEKEGEEIQKEMENVDEVFVKMAAENHKEFEKILDREFGTKKKSNRPVMYKVAMVLLVVILGFGVSVATVPALRSAVVDFVNYVTGRYTEVGESNTKEVETVEKTGQQNDFFEKEFRVNYIPKGFVLLDINKSRQRISYNYICEKESDKYIAFSQYGNGLSSNIDTEGAQPELIKINRNKAMLYKEGEVFVLVWKKYNYELVLESKQIRKSEIIKIAESIK